MRLPSSSADAAIMSTILFPLLSAAAGSYPCDRIRVDKTDFNLSKLGGARSIMHHYENHNTTYTVDICKALGKVKEAPADEQCPNGTQGMLRHSYVPLMMVACASLTTK
jgi:hypothetical protein